MNHKLSVFLLFSTIIMEVSWLLLGFNLPMTETHGLIPILKAPLPRITFVKFQQDLEADLSLVSANLPVCASSSHKIFSSLFFNVNETIVSKKLL